MDKKSQAIFDEKMRGLIEEYKGTLGEYRDELDRHLAAEAEWSEADKKKILSVLHGVGGSAAMYGFAELGDEARVIELRLEEAAPPYKALILQDLKIFREKCSAAALS